MTIAVPLILHILILQSAYIKNYYFEKPLTSEFKCAKAFAKFLKPRYVFKKN